MLRNNDNAVTSIILTTCCVNDFRLQLLKLSLRSLRITTGGRKQLILCDNGDARQTEYLKRVKSEKHLIFGENKGITFARNAGAEEATGDYICFVDGDLVYRPFWLSRLKGLLRKFKDKSLIASGYYGEAIGRLRIRCCVESDIRYQIWTRASGGCLLMPKDVWDKVGPWPDVWKIGSQFSCRANRFGYNFIVPLPDVVHPIDYKPSYNKNHLRNTYLKGKPEWKMV